MRRIGCLSEGPARQITSKYTDRAYYGQTQLHSGTRSPGRSQTGLLAILSTPSKFADGASDIVVAAGADGPR